jgi:hypothetical protein
MRTTMAAQLISTPWQRSCFREWAGERMKNARQLQTDQDEDQAI